MDHISIVTTQNVKLETAGAGIGKRFLAVLLDYLVIIAAEIAILMLISMANIINSWLVFTVFSIIFFFYHFFWEILTDGQSLGKKAVDIRVVKDTGESAGAMQYFIRALFRPVDMFFGVGLLLMIFNPKNKRLGDMVAGTMVVKNEKAIGLDETVLMEFDEQYKPLLERRQIIALKPRHIELMKQTLELARKKKDYKKLTMIFPQVCKLIGIEPGELPEGMLPVDFIERVIKDYNYYA